MTQAPAPANPTPPKAPALRALLITTSAERDQIRQERDRILAERDALLSENDRLRHLLLRLKRMQFGAKSERIPEEQYQLALEDIEQALGRDEAEGEKRDPKQRDAGTARRRARSAALPKHLPRIEEVLTPEDTACPCCKAEMVVIGEDSSERLDCIPAQYRVIVTRRPKLACRACPGTMVQKPAPPRLIEVACPPRRWWPRWRSRATPTISRCIARRR